MDLITSVEPQVALPVVGAVLCAFLVYIFGFQKSQEPSFQHLAVLTEKKTKTRQPTTQVQSQKTKGPVQQQVAKSKPLANGHAVTEKTPKSPKVLPKENKENVKPKKKDPKEKPTEDFEGGEWIQAFSRKEKNAKREKKQKEEVKAKEEVVEKVEKVEKIEVVLERMRAESPKKEAPEPPKEEKKEVEKKVEMKVEKKEEKKPVEKKQAEKKKEEPLKKPIEEKVEEKVVSAPLVEETKTNVAFDELGDSWEEAKSRGTKKRRARKD